MTNCRLIFVRSMRRSLSFAYTTCLLFCFTHQGLSQIGQTKEELIRRYGRCHADPAGTTEEPNAYDSVIDVGKNCTFRSENVIIAALFKGGKAVAFDYRAQHTFAESLSAAQSEDNRGLSELEIFRVLGIAVPGAQWVNIPGNSIIKRWRTKDSTAFAYYFAGGNYHRHELLVQTAAVDAVFQKTDKVIRGLWPK
jgi:hypothetical protein